jgi:hypothetical protein
VVASSRETTYPLLQIVQLVLSEQVWQLTEQAAQLPIEFLKNPLPQAELTWHFPATSVTPVGQERQAEGPAWEQEAQEVSQAEQSWPLPKKPMLQMQALARVS